MTAVPEPGNSIFDDLSAELGLVISVAIRGGKPLKLDLGTVSLFEAAGALRAALRLVEEAMMDFIECDELEIEDAEDDDD